MAFLRSLVLEFSICDRGQVYLLNNSVTFSGKPMGSEEFLNQMVEALSTNKKNRMCPYFNYLPPLKSLYLQGFQKIMGTGFSFCLALNAGGQKKTVPSFLLNARGVPLNVPQFSKNRQLRPPFLAYFCLSQITKPL